MFKLDKDDVKAIARRRARIGLVRRLEFGFLGALALMTAVIVVEMFGVRIPNDIWIIGSAGIIGIVLVVVASSVGKIRFRRIFKDLEKQAGLVK